MALYFKNLERRADMSRNDAGQCCTGGGKSPCPFGRQFKKDAVYFGGGIRRAGDLAADDQVGGSVANGQRRCGYALLIPCVSARRADPRRDQDSVRSDDPA